MNTVANNSSTPTARFKAVVEASGKNTTGIPVPDMALSRLGRGKRPKVTARLGDAFSYRTTVGSYDGRAFLSVSAAVREAAGIAAGDEVEVELTVDDAPRDVELPSDLATALSQKPAARTAFDNLTDSQRNTFVLSVTSAKKPETRARRVEAAVSALADGRKRP